MSILLIAGWWRAELMYRLALMALAIVPDGRQSIGVMLSLYRAAEYWDRQRACNHARL